MTQSQLEALIKAEISENGPMGIDRYMSLCLGHPMHGYYMTRDPLGAQGDFTTAPEISQMFGEIIGAWIIDTWQKLGAPSPFTLLECGAGRGTLMADVMRVAKAVPAFIEAVDIVLLETSPVLIKKQQEQLSAYNPQWIAQLDELNTQTPIIVIGNEFLDALPIRQFQKNNSEIKEKRVGLNEHLDLCFGLNGTDIKVSFPLDIKEGDCVELSPVRNAFIKDICSYIKTHGGAGLFIDYGYNQKYADTFQALKGHEFIDPLTNVGEADLTAHVDFMSLRKLCREEGIHEYGIVKQADFLKALGIVTRAEILKQNASKEQSEKIARDLERLISLDHMGKLFKVMAFSSKQLPIAGFSL